MPDVICQEYAIPSLEHNQLYSPESSLTRPPPPPALNFLPKPPPVPPPPERYYTTSEMCDSVPVVPPSPPLSPSSSRLSRSKISRHFMLPLSPEPEDCSDRDVDDIQIETFPRERLSIIEKLGDGHYGDVHLCEVQTNSENNEEQFSECKFVAVYTLTFEKYKEEFDKEVHALSRLKDFNIARLLGACLDTEPICAVREFTEMGDLCQFLQEHVAETTTPLTSTANTLRYFNL